MINYDVFVATLPTTVQAGINLQDLNKNNVLFSGLPSYTNVNISGGILNGLWDSWGISAADSISRVLTPVTAYIYPTVGNNIPPSTLFYDGAVPISIPTFCNQFNWLINNVMIAANAVGDTYIYNGVTYYIGDIQLAIYKLIGTPANQIILSVLKTYDTTQVKANNLVNIATTLGSDFAPISGQFIGVIMSYGGAIPTQEPTIISIPTSGIGGQIWNDTNYNGLLDVGELGILGTSVSLEFLNSTYSTIGTTTTNSSGNYSFGPLLAGTYKVQFTQPSGYTNLSPFQIGSNPSIYSNANTGTLLSNAITMSSGQVNSNINAGFYNISGRSTTGQLFPLFQGNTRSTSSQLYPTGS